MHRAIAAVVAGLSAALVTSAVTLAAMPEAAVRVDQLGFATGEPKIAYLLGTADRPDAPFTVVDGSGAR